MSARTAPKRRPRPERNTDAKTRGRFARARGWIAGGVIGAVVVTVAVVAQGFDAQEVPRQEPSVWVARDAGQYARVNTETGEIDTVRKVSEPSGVVQAGARSAVLTNGNGRAWPVDQAMSVDFTDQDDAAASGAETNDDAANDDAANEAAEGAAAEQAAADAGAGGSAAAEAVRLPDGTREVLVAGNYLMLRTEAGAVYIGTLGEDAAAGDGAGGTLGAGAASVAGGE
ncbi:hypothetical protein ACFSWE_04515, partial [Leucobacter albus]